MATATLAPTRFWGVRIVVPILSVFAGPAYTFEVVATLQQDDQVEVIGRTADGSWLYVVLEDETEGWIPAGGATPLDDDLLAIVPTVASLPVTATTAPTPTPDGNPISEPTSPPPPPPPAPTNTRASPLATPSPIPEPTRTSTPSIGPGGN